MSSPAQIIILAEDIRTSRLIRGWVKRRLSGVSDRIIRESKMSEGRGSGAQMVLNQYEGEVRAYIGRHPRSWLIVVIDSDNFSLQQRLSQLALKLSESAEERVRQFQVDSEQIARLIPRWSIETWLLYLNDEMVNELISYKDHRDWDGMIKPAAARLYSLTSGEEIPESCTPSLTHGVSELRRLTR